MYRKNSFELGGALWRSDGRGLKCARIGKALSSPKRLEMLNLLAQGEKNLVRSRMSATRKQVFINPDPFVIRANALFFHLGNQVFFT